MKDVAVKKSLAKPKRTNEGCMCLQNGYVYIIMPMWQLQKPEVEGSMLLAIANCQNLPLSSLTSSAKIRSYFTSHGAKLILITHFSGQD
jgi:hypothetical protein